MDDATRDVPGAPVAAPELDDKADVLADVADAIETVGLDEGSRILGLRYPFVLVEKTSRSYTERRSLRLFYRDGFVDRYSGTRLVK
nr:hypothetical protein [Dietzia sp. DQ11-71]